MNEQNNTDCLKLLNDSVLDLKNGKDKDSFNHNIYAKLLANIFNPASGNDAGISVALFGKWGQGKSSVVQMMESLISDSKTEGKAESYKATAKVIWFNAWKTRGDHVRRQLLLSIIKGIESPKYEEISRFVQPGNPLVIRPYCVQEQVNKKTHWWVMTRDEKLDPLICWAVGIGLISVVAFIALFIGNLNPKNDWSDLCLGTILPFIGACMAVVYRWFCNRKEQLLTSAEPVSDSQRLKYPDQFQRVFEEELAEYKKRDGTPIIIVVDDLDRCEASTVVEALACIRQLGGKPIYESTIADCRFLVPCDESQVLSALEKDGHHKGYEKEDLLRKFFDVIIRMDAFLPDDMVSYATKMLQSCDGMTDADIDSIQELIGAVCPRNPRQVKKLINAYIIFKAKTNYLQAEGLLRTKDKLEFFDKTSLLVIALQETVPDVYEKITESTDELDKFDPEKSKERPLYKLSESEERALIIIRALEPISRSTFNLLTRKGIPESLKEIENGPTIYDAFLVGKADAFETEILKTSKVEALISWLKEHRKTLTSVAQFRNALPCLLKPDPLPPWLSDVIDDYVTNFKKLPEALYGYDGLLDVAKKTKTLGHCKRKIHNTVINNFRNTKSNHLYQNELKAIFLFGDELSDAAKTLLVNTLIPLINGENNAQTEAQLTALRNALTGNDSVNIPQLALTIATKCTWSIYNTNEPEKNKGVHSDLIAAFVGEDEETTSNIAEELFAPNGPLGTLFNFKAGNSPKGEREALRTLAKIAKNLTGIHIQKLFEKLFPWLKLQPDVTDYKSICDIMSHIWTSMTEKQIDEFVIHNTDRVLNTNTTDWFLNFVDSGNQGTNSEVQIYSYFCKKVLNRLNEIRLMNNTFDEATKKLLKGMAEQKWPIVKEADALFEAAIRSKVGDKPSWELWSSAFWPLVQNYHPLTEQAIIDKIQNNGISEILIPFAVESLCKRKLTSSLRIALKQLFCANPNIISNASFNKLLGATDVEGVGLVIDLIVDDLISGKTKLDEPRIEFLVNNFGLAKKETKSRIMDFIRIHYLQDSNQATFLKGVYYVSLIKQPPSDVVQQVKERAAELWPAIPDKQRQVIVAVLGNDMIIPG